MSTTVDIKCPNCGELLYCETRTPLWLLALGRVSFKADCSNCGYRKMYRLVSAKRAGEMMEEAKGGEGRR
jgi:predicted RNA-binding Zn-ribbon protein involved in translation (DUF1610 family)